VLLDYGQTSEEVKEDIDGFVAAMETFSMIRPSDLGVLVKQPIA
jgi:hypothetical protein